MTQTPDTHVSPPPVGPHEFTGLRQWGMNPSDDKECVICSIPKGVHPRRDAATEPIRVYLDAIAAEITPLRDQLYLIAERLNLVTKAVTAERDIDNPSLPEAQNQAVFLARSVRELADYARDMADRVAPE